MTPSIAPPGPVTVDDLRAEGTAFGRSWRGRPRSRFEESLVKRLNALSEALAAQALDEDEAIAAFDTAAWDTWEASVTSSSPAVGSQGLGSAALAPSPPPTPTPSGRGKTPPGSQNG